RAAADHKVAFVQREGSLLEVWEEQLLGMFGAECLVCLPLVAQEHCIGMLIGAASQQRIAQLSWNGGFLQAYAAPAAQALQAAQRERLIRSDQAASIAEEYKEASRRVAHEVNNPLSIIKNYRSILNDKLQKNQPVGSELSILNEEIDR